MSRLQQVGAGELRRRPALLQVQRLEQRLEQRLAGTARIDRLEPARRLQQFTRLSVMSLGRAVGQAQAAGSGLPGGADPGDGEGVARMEPRQAAAEVVG